MICLKVQAIELHSMMDSSSTPGNFSGELYLSFSSLNGGDYSAGNWSEAQILPIYTVGGAQIFLSFTVGPESPGELNLYTGVNFSDDRIGSPEFSLPNANPIISPGDFIVGHPRVDDMNYSSGNVPLFDVLGLPSIGTLDFTYSLPVDFDGTSGSAAGSWSLTYTINDDPKVPDAGATILLLAAACLLLGGFYFGTFRAKSGRAN
jgi:hypothetical protein